VSGDFLIRATIWLSLLGWSLAEWWRLEGAPTEGARRAARAAWTTGAVFALVHVLLAFHVRHAWSHAAAVADTARQTRELLGREVGAGVYFNYVFLAVWLADAAWWWIAPRSFGARPPAVDRAVRLFLLFMFVNGAVVFPRGPVRLAGLVLVAGLAAAWYRGRGARETTTRT